MGGVEIFQDITELKALERERANLVSMFAHDMKSPLVGIQGFALRLLKKGDLTDAQKQTKYLEIIRREAAQLEKIINDFLDFTRLETGNLKLNFSAVYLDKEFLELWEAFQPRFDQQAVKLSMVGTENLPVIQGDAANLRRAFTNLLDNALKYSPSGTQVRIEAEAVGETVILRFIDQGAGITPEELPFIFDMFYRASSHGKQPGHGLGLAGVEAIVKGHGSRVMVSSEVGEGSVFSVMLPVSQPEGRTGRAAWAGTEIGLDRELFMKAVRPAAPGGGRLGVRQATTVGVAKCYVEVGAMPATTYAAAWRSRQRSPRPPGEAAQIKANISPLTSASPNQPSGPGPC